MLNIEIILTYKNDECFEDHKIFSINRTNICKETVMELNFS